MKKTHHFALLFAVAMLSACQGDVRPAAEAASKENRQVINNWLDQWHRDAAAADKAFFKKMSADGIYIGTDKTEHWTRPEFKNWCRPYFDLGKAWDFKVIERNLYLGEDGRHAWFDELLDTWMGTCRASGVLVRNSEDWKIVHYHLSVTVPNDTMSGFIEMVQAYEKSHEG
ncbi:MAG: nuclear transport factor 2 family protein [Owenweeksia sp.]|nr:nuclear transport factor 2 family protein [Owenweeksia sp.]